MASELNRCRYAKDFGDPFADNKPGEPKNGKRPPAGAAWDEKGMASKAGNEPNSYTGYDSAPPPQTAQYKDWGSA